MSTCRKPDWADDVANVRHPVKFAPVDPHFDRPTRDSLHQGDGAGEVPVPVTLPVTLPAALSGRPGGAPAEPIWATERSSAAAAKRGNDVFMVHDPCVAVKRHLFNGHPNTWVT